MTDDVPGFPGNRYRGRLGDRMRKQDLRAEVFSWNPRRAAFGGPLARFSPRKRPVNNFGDLLGPMIVERLARSAGRDPNRPRGQWQLMSVGSVLHFAREGAVVWGAGINGKVDPGVHRFDRLDVRAVRGPRTAAVLRSRGISVPNVFGDPALLVPQLFPNLVDPSAAATSRAIAFVPNLNDVVAGCDIGRDAVLVDPRDALATIATTIARSTLVVASSLHGLVLAEAYSVPARMLMPRAEHILKYQDYYEATGRPDFRPARSFAEAVALGGEAPPIWDPGPLIDAFPAELWSEAVHDVS